MVTAHRKQFISHCKKQKFGNIAADKLTTFMGSWTFIIIIFIVIACWMAINTYSLFTRWDKYPFILLNFVLSCIAAVSAPIILMSQNREEQRDRKRAEYDYYVNRKAEREIQRLQEDLKRVHQKVDKIHQHVKKK